MCIQAYSCVRCAPHCLITTHDQHAVDMQPICSVRSMFDTDAPDFIGRSLVMPLAWSVAAIRYRVSMLTARTGCVVIVAYRLWADCIH